MPSDVDDGAVDVADSPWSVAKKRSVVPVEEVPLGVVGGVSLIAVRDFVSSCLSHVRPDCEGERNAKERRG